MRKEGCFFFPPSFFINAIESVIPISSSIKAAQNGIDGVVSYFESVAMERVCCSIDMEPKTLNEGELNNAREAAVDMAQKAEQEEAPNIFTKGLKPVISIKGVEKEVERINQLHNLVELKENAETIQRTWDCQCTSTALEESPDMTTIKEPLSAPF